jgi:hypothetical protein
MTAAEDVTAADLPAASSKDPADARSRKLTAVMKAKQSCFAQNYISCIADANAKAAELRTGLKKEDGAATDSIAEHARYIKENSEIEKEVANLTGFCERQIQVTVDGAGSKFVEQSLTKFKTGCTQTKPEERVACVQGIMLSNAKAGARNYYDSVRYMSPGVRDFVARKCKAQKGTGDSLSCQTSALGEATLALEDKNKSFFERIGQATYDKLGGTTKHTKAQKIQAGKEVWLQEQLNNANANKSTDWLAQIYGARCSRTEVNLNCFDRVLKDVKKDVGQALKYSRSAYGHYASNVALTNACYQNIKSKEGCLKNGTWINAFIPDKNDKDFAFINKGTVIPYSPRESIAGTSAVKKGAVSGGALGEQKSDALATGAGIASVDSGDGNGTAAASKTSPGNHGIQSASGLGGEGKYTGGSSAGGSNQASQHSCPKGQDCSNTARFLFKGHKLEKQGKDIFKCPAALKDYNCVAGAKNYTADVKGDTYNLADREDYCLNIIRGKACETSQVYSNQGDKETQITKFSDDAVRAQKFLASKAGWKLKNLMPNSCEIERDQPSKISPSELKVASSPACDLAIKDFKKEKTLPDFSDAKTFQLSLIGKVSPVAQDLALEIQKADRRHINALYGAYYARELAIRNYKYKAMLDPAILTMSDEDFEKVLNDPKGGIGKGDTACLSGKLYDAATSEVDVLKNQMRNTKAELAKLYCASYLNANPGSSCDLKSGVVQSYFRANMMKGLAAASKTYTSIKAASTDYDSVFNSLGCPAKLANPYIKPLHVKDKDGTRVSLGKAESAESNSRRNQLTTTLGAIMQKNGMGSPEQFSVKIDAENKVDCKELQEIRSRVSAVTEAVTNAAPLITANVPGYNRSLMDMLNTEYDAKNWDPYKKALAAEVGENDKELDKICGSGAKLPDSLIEVGEREMVHSNTLGDFVGCKDIGPPSAQCVERRSYGDTMCSIFNNNANADQHKKEVEEARQHRNMAIMMGVTVVTAGIPIAGAIVRGGAALIVAGEAAQGARLAFAIQAGMTVAGASMAIGMDLVPGYQRMKATAKDKEETYRRSVNGFGTYSEYLNALKASDEAGSAFVQTAILDTLFMGMDAAFTGVTVHSLYTARAAKAELTAEMQEFKAFLRSPKAEEMWKKGVAWEKAHKSGKGYNFYSEAVYEKLKSIPQQLKAGELSLAEEYLEVVKTDLREIFGAAAIGEKMEAGDAMALLGFVRKVRAEKAAGRITAEELADFEARASKIAIECPNTI